MTVVDANLLIYAVDRGSRHHQRAKAWLDSALSGAETVIFPWVCLLAFLRLTTQAGVFEEPLSVDQAVGVVEAWTSQPEAMLGIPGGRHIELLRRLLTATGSGGNLVNDAHVAALALEHGATVMTYDNDFGRFPGVRWRSP